MMAHMFSEWFGRRVIRLWNFILFPFSSISQQKFPLVHHTIPCSIPTRGKFQPLKIALTWVVWAACVGHFRTTSISNVSAGICLSTNIKKFTLTPNHYEHWSPCVHKDTRNVREHKIQLTQNPTHKFLSHTSAMPVFQQPPSGLSRGFHEACVWSFCP